MILCGKGRGKRQRTKRPLPRIGRICPQAQMTDVQLARRPAGHRNFRLLIDYRKRFTLMPRYPHGPIAGHKAVPRWGQKTPRRRPFQDADVSRACPENARAR